MKNKIPTYQEAKEIIKHHGSLVFYDTVAEIDDYVIIMFNYRLATYNDLLKPLPHIKPNLSGVELRGISYVLDKKTGEVMNTYIMLNKFWNLNETLETQYDNIVNNYKIKAIHNKEDGSMVRFIRLPNGKVLSKTKGSIDNEICIQCNKIYKENETINNLINWSLDNDIVLIFEFVSPFNKIVLDYNETKLILLKARDNNTGEYLSIDSLLIKFNQFKYGSNIHNYVMDYVVDDYEQYSSIDELIELSKTIIGIEGWVINLIDNNSNDYFIKLKTKWYMDRHKLLTEDCTREDFIIGKILDETIDDMLAQLNDNDIEIKNKINNIDKVVKSHISNKINEVNQLLNEYNNKYINNRKDFAIKYSNNLNFKHVMNIISGKKNIFETIVEELRKETYKLNDAIRFVKKW